MQIDVEPILVAVLGNPDAGDDALGPRVGCELLRRQLVHVDVVDLGSDTSRLLQLLHGREMLVIVDAVQSDDAGGRIVDCPWGDAVAAVARDVNLSSHGLSVADQLKLAEALDMLPPLVWFVGVTSNSFERGRTCRSSLPRLAKSAADRVMAAIRTRGHCAGAEISHA